MMDAFSYLSVLLSIILGLAITQVLQGFRGLMIARSRLHAYWPCIAWAVLLLVLDVQVWWAMYILRWRHVWSFVSFAAVLAQTIPLYLLAGLVLPDAGTHEQVDLRRHYYDNHRWFFAILALLLVASFIKQLVLFGNLPASMDTGIQLLFLIAAVAAACTSREWFHKALVPFSAITVGAYIAVLYPYLH
jgi:hypothetical protein